MRARRKQAAREFNEKVWFLWHHAALQRAKKLPALKSMQVPVEQPRRQTWQEQFAIAQTWVSLGVGTIREG